MTATTTAHSSFSHLFHSNYAASDDEVPLIRNLISTSSDALDRLNSLIERLQAALRKLEQERDSLQDYVSAHSGLLSPKRLPALPAEILSAIFTHCLPDDRNTTCNHSEAPLLLGRICKNWRDVSLSTPQLWASIHIVIPKLRGNPSVLCPLIHPRINGIEAWLSRSGTLPLSISVYAALLNSQVRGQGQGHSESGLDHIRELLDILFQRSNRWRTIKLAFDNACMSILEEYWPWGAHRELPCLQTFHLSRPDGPARGQPEQSAAKWFLHAPHLRRLSLRHLGIEDLLEGHFPWSQLTQLGLEVPSSSYIPVSAAIRVLSQCRNLYSLSMSYVESRTEDPALPTEAFTITLPFLRNLSIKSAISLSDSYDVQNLFCYLDTPVLQCLRLDVDDYVDDRGIFGFLDCSNPFINLLFQGNQITELDIRASSRILAETLSLLPNLTILRIRNNTLNDAFLRRLTPICNRPPNELLCPSLEQLYLLGDSLITDEQLLLDLVHSRWNGARTSNSHAAGSRPSGTVARLDAFHVLLRRCQQVPDLHHQLQRLRDQGMDVVFSHLEEPASNISPSAGQGEDIRSGIAQVEYLSLLRSDQVRRHSWWT